MKEILTLMAEYNQSVNKKLYGLLAKEEPGILTGEHGSYFGGILGILNHVLVSDLTWFSAFRDSDLDFPALRSPVLDFERPEWRANLYSSLDDLASHRTRLDALIADFAESTDEAVFTGSITVTHPSGKTLTCPFGKLLMHVFNHQSHHRGAVSQILDERGVENDYSNLLALLMR